MSRIEVKSCHIAALEYSVQTSTLKVTNREIPGGRTRRVYAYYPVMPTEFSSVANAESIGKAVNALIRCGGMECTRLDDEMLQVAA